MELLKWKLGLTEFRLREYAEVYERGQKSRDRIDKRLLKFSKLLSPQLFCKPPILWDRNLWVFSGTITSASSSRSKLTKLEEKIKTLLGDYSYTRKGILIQFWAPLPTKTGQCILTTVDQPFAMDRPRPGLCAYRNESLSYQFAVEDEEVYDNSEKDQFRFGGVLGRVFRNKCPESPPDMRSYSNEEYPQRQLALRCGVNASLAWPVWEPSGNTRCVGVLEIVSTHEYCIGGFGTHSKLITKLQGSENDEEAVVLDSPELIVEDDLQHAKRTFGNGITNTIIPSEETCLTRTSKRVQRDTESGIGFKDLNDLVGHPLDDAAQRLNVSRSTFKRLCRKHNITRWQGRRSKKMRGSLSNSNISSGNKFSGIGEEQTAECSSRKPTFPDLPAMQGAADVVQTIPQVAQNMNNITVKAKHNGVLIKFELSFSSSLAELEEEVKKRLIKLKDGSFSIKYEDEESEWVLIACDEDLQYCMDSSKSLNRTTIRMMVDLPINNQAP